MNYQLTNLPGGAILLSPAQAATTGAKQSNKRKTVARKASGKASKSWTPERRAQYQATMAAKRASRGSVPGLQQSALPQSEQ